MKKQRGYIFRSGDAWFVRFRDTFVEDGRLVRKQVARKIAAVEPEHSRLKRAPQSVLDIADGYLRPVNDSKVTPESTQTLTTFVEQVYFPYAKTQKRASTTVTDRSRWKIHLKPRCGEIRLREFRTVTGEQLIADIARQNELSRATLKQFKSFLSAIFKHAKRLGLLDGENPMRDVSIPKNARGKAVTSASSLEEIQGMLRILPEPCRTVIAVAAYAGLRRGEIQGLRWEHYDGKQLNVEQSIWEGIAADPKSESSKASVPVISALAKTLNHFKLLQGNPADGPIFRASNGSALRLNNLLRSILPVLNRCKACGESEVEHDENADHDYLRDESRPKWQGWHAFRRGLATNLHAIGVDDLTIQRILRHSNVQVTQQSYIKTLPQQVTDAMDQLNAKVAAGESVQ
jgi:integrase